MHPFARTSRDSRRPANPSAGGSARRMQGAGSGGFCCQVPPNPACRSLSRQGFKIGIPNRLRSLGNRSIVVVGNYEFGPITAEPCREKARPLRPRRSYFAPAEGRLTTGLGWRRRVLPPGPKGLLRRPFIAIAGLRRRSQYRGEWFTKKARCRTKEAERDVSCETFPNPGDRRRGRSLS